MAWNVVESIKNLIYTKDKSGNHNYFYGNKPSSWTDLNKKSNLFVAQNHPILTPALLFVSKLFSQAKFTVVHKDTGKVDKSHWMTKLFDQPNLYQTKSDFLETLQFIEIAQGKAVGYIKRPIGFNENSDIDSIYILDSDLIYWGDYSSRMLNKSAQTFLDNEEIIYDPEGENIKIKIRDLLFFYDMPNMMTYWSGSKIGGVGTSDISRRNFFETTSRLDGLRQTLINTQDSLLAKNIILKTNGKELISGGNNENFPLAGEDKENAESLLQNNYGLGWFRKRGIVTKASINWQSLHIALRDLGLDESVKVDGNLIYTALHIPKDIISLEAKKTTYNNFKESMVSYIQNEMQSSINAFTDVMNTLLVDEDYKLVGSYEHLPIMQFILIERYEGVAKRAFALQSLRNAGVPDEEALELTDFDKGLNLAELEQAVDSTVEESKRLEKAEFHALVDKLEKRIEELEREPNLY